MAAATGSTPPISTLSIHSRNNPIDLTHDDDDLAEPRYFSSRSKRPRPDPLDPMSTDQCPPSCYQSNSPPTAFNSNSPRSTSQNPDPFLLRSQSSTPHLNPPSPYTRPYQPTFTGPNLPGLMNPYPPPRPQFSPGPQNPHYPQPSPQQLQRNPPPLPGPPFPQEYRSPFPPPFTPNPGNQVIDLTDSPSPPPSVAHNIPAGLSPVNPQDPPKTPVCIGQLLVNALILCPVPYLVPRDPYQEFEWAPVRLQHEHNPNRMPNPETIHIRTPSERTLNGDITPGENFAFVEQKVATSLGGMLGKGLIRLEAKIRRGKPNLPVIPLQLLVYTPKGNITVVGNYLQQCNLLLDHPNPPYDDLRLTTYPYFNPHYPPPEGHPRPLILNNRMYGPNGGTPSRWSESTIGKSQDVQRTQIDELFKHLKDGVELPETEPSSDVATGLYPHQKKALTFLLDREHEKPVSHGQFSSLWRKQFDPMSQRQKWVNVVTEEDTAEEPKEAKSAILADDMGLGKTITCMSLIAATLQSAKDFATQPLQQLQQPPTNQNINASHFSGAVWGMPDSPVPTSSKAKAKADRTQEKLDAEYVRACRIKARSRATLIICPLSTVANWEEQFREHWRGEVTVVGGNGNCANNTASSSTTGSTNGTNTPTVDTKPEKPARMREGNPLRVYIYHGNARRPDPTFLADFDAVITTFATLASEFSKQNRTAQAASEDGEDTGGGASSDGGVSGRGEAGMPDMEIQTGTISLDPKPKKTGTKRKKPMTTISSTEVASPLQSIHWFRVVLDEAHSIKETQTVGSRASCDLAADRRLCLTGTPVQNKLDDMFALIKFLRLRPFDDKNIWTKHISAPAKFGQREGVLKLRTIMACITLRRTKETKTPDGERILALPPRENHIIRLVLNPAEQEIYHQYFQESKDEFTDLSKKNQVMKNYVGILQRLLRLRQICDHKDLIKSRAAGVGLDPTASYEDTVAAITREGINATRASAIFAILREAATTQCTECGGELCTLAEGAGGAANDIMDTDGPPPSKRGRKSKGQASRAPTRASSPSGGPRPVLTRCQHLFCLECYRSAICPGWPDVPTTLIRQCSTCQSELSPSDAVEIKSDMIGEGLNGGSVEGKKVKKVTKEERMKKQETRLQEIEAQLIHEQGLRYQVHPNFKMEPDVNTGPPELQTLLEHPESQDGEMKLETDVSFLGLPPPNIREQAIAFLQEEIYERSTKIKSLIHFLMPFSIANPHSANYDPAGLDVQIVDSDGNGSSDNVIKTVVFSQWTSMLDKIEDALLIHKIRYDRLDGTMKREERSKALDNLKYDPGCEVLLVSLKAGGVGLNLTAAQKVILMDPCWNPAVENQAVDRIHRLGQTKPVLSIKYIISNSIEENMLKIQERKNELAQITLGARTKAEIMEQRMEQLKELFK